jgi:hypothetical protein
MITHFEAGGGLEPLPCPLILYKQAGNILVKPCKHNNITINLTSNVKDYLESIDYLLAVLTIIEAT